MPFEMTSEKNMQVIKVEMKYLDSPSISAFKEQIVLDELTTEKVLLDLSSVQFIDSAGLGAIIGLNRRLLNKRQRLGLVAANDRVTPTLELVQLHKIVPIFKSLDLAVSEDWICIV